MDALSVLTAISVLLILGIVIDAVSRRLKVPDVIFLIIAGIGLSRIPYMGGSLINFPQVFLTAISLLALAMIVFNSAARLKFRELDAFSTKALWLAMAFLFFSMLILPWFAKLFFGMPIIMGMVFAAVVAGTSPEITLSILGSSKAKAIGILKFESIMNTPLTVLIPFLMLDIAGNVEKALFSHFIEQAIPFLTKFVAGIGSGILVGLVLFRALKHTRSKIYGPLSVMMCALLCFVLAENVGGNGVLAVTSLGLFVGNLYKKQKVEQMLSFETLIATSLYFLVFMLIGFMIRIPFTLGFIWRASAMLGIYFAVRYISLEAIFPGKSREFKFGEKIFMVFNAPKGIAVATVVFTMSTFVEGIPYLKEVLDLILFFMVCSIVFSTGAVYFCKPLLGEALLK